jgi:hypothetical protein
MDPPATTMMLRDEGSLLVAGSFFLAVACVLGFVVYRLMSHPPARRAELRTWPACSKSTSAFAGVALATSVFAGFAATSLLGFHRIEISEHHVVLGYVLPFDDVSLRRADLAQVRRDPETGVAWRLVFETRDGHRYESVPARADVVAAICARIERGP